MEKNNKLILISIIILTTFVLIFCGYLLFKRNVNLDDAEKFRNEYMEFNDKVTNTGEKYPLVNIPNDNTVVYAKEEDIIEILKSKSGVIYFGFNSCPWCRSMVETLIKAIDDNNIENAYYVDVLDIRDTYEVKKKKLTQTKEGTEAYYSILEYLDEYLTDYVLESGNKKYDTKEKRLYAPTVVVVKDGEIVGFHEGTVDSQEDPYLGLNEEEKVELEKIFKEQFKDLISNTCEDERGC